MAYPVTKLIYASIFALLVVGYGISRWLSNRRNSNYGLKLIKALDASPQLADEVAADHQNQYAKVLNQGSKPIWARLSSLPKDQILLKKYQIMGIYRLKNEGVLLVTSCRDQEIGEMKNNAVVKKYTFSFVVQHRAASGEIEVCSDYYELLIDRLLRQEFATYLAKMVEQNG